MPAPRQAAGAGAGARKNKGTRGGRPEPQPVAAQARRPAAQAQRPGPGRPGQAQRARERRAAEAAATAAPEPGIRIPPLWFQLTTWALALAGLGVSTYLTITHYDSSVPLACSDKGVINCALVTSSAESMVFGVLPVAVLGLAFYVFMTAAVSPWAWRLKFPALTWVRVASVVIGIGFVLYLVYTELFTLDAICLWCTSVHVLTFLLFALIVGGAAAGYGLRERDYAS
ncbi:MAG TPA: vitamin K epoxide reductase family protein [Streptosporangiaceae bacterium]